MTSTRPTAHEVDQLVEHAQSLFLVLAERTLRKRRRLFKVGQKSRRSNGQYFIKTDRGWRRVAKNPRKPVASGGGWSTLAASMSTAFKDAHQKSFDRWSGKKPGQVRDGQDLFKKGKRTKSPKPKRRRGSPLPKRGSSWGST